MKTKKNIEEIETWKRKDWRNHVFSFKTYDKMEMLKISFSKTKLNVLDKIIRKHIFERVDNCQESKQKFFNLGKDQE